jgi:hypothetical protein
MMNYRKTYFSKFLTRKDQEINIQVCLGNRKIPTTQSLKFLGLTIDASLTWKYIGELTSRPRVLKHFWSAAHYFAMRNIAANP